MKKNTIHSFNILCLEMIKEEEKSYFINLFIFQSKVKQSDKLQ